MKTESFVFGRVAEISERDRRQNDRAGDAHLFCCLHNRKKRLVRPPCRLRTSMMSKGIHKGGRPPKAAAPLCGGGAKRRLLCVEGISALRLVWLVRSARTCAMLTKSCVFLKPKVLFPHCKIGLKLCTASSYIEQNSKIRLNILRSLIFLYLRIK